MKSFLPALALLSISPGLTSCTETKQSTVNTPQSSDPVSIALVKMQQLDVQKPTEETLMQARRAALEFMRLQMPEWKVEGIAAVPDSAASMVFSVDASLPKDRRTFYVSVKLFINNEGQMYWKVSLYLVKDAQGTGTFTIATFSPAGIPTPSKEYNHSSEDDNSSE